MADNKHWTQASGKVRDVIPNCELIYEGNSQEDYHKSMNGTMFMLWLENRLIPTFKSMYGDKKMILVLDNASFHHHRGDDYVSLSGLRKDQFIALLTEKFKISSLTVTRHGRLVSYDKSVWANHGGNNAPTLKELKFKSEQELKSHPDMTKTEVEKLFDRHQYKLIYTPPYCPSSQPIETVWANVKRYVALKYFKGRNPATLRQHLQEGFYGGDNWEGITKDQIAGILKKVHNYCNDLIECDDILDGSIWDLRQITPCITRVVDEDEIELEAEDEDTDEQEESED